MQDLFRSMLTWIVEYVVIASLLLMAIHLMVRKWSGVKSKLTERSRAADTAQTPPSDT